MNNVDRFNRGENFRLADVKLKCPTCDKYDELKIPYKIINKSKHLTTVSIPSGLICEHNFQAFIDKNFNVRGYQKIDFEFTKMEFYEKTTENDEQIKINDLSSLPQFEKILRILRNCVDNKEVLGSALFTIEGQALYSSLPQNTLLDTIKEFEVRNESKLLRIKKMFLEIENNQKVCCYYSNILNNETILVLIFSESVKLGMANLLLRELAKKVSSF
jgi:hypothetical protein